MRAISFDFWNTLFTPQAGDFRYYRLLRLRQLADALGSAGGFDDGRIERAMSGEAAEHHRIWILEQRTLGASERLRKILDLLCAEVPDDVFSKLVSAFEEGILERPPVLVEGAGEALTELASSYSLGIISDVGFSPGRVLKQVLGETGLLHLFDSLIFSDEAGRSKPHVELFNETARTLGAKPREMVHVGDLEHTDVAGAKNAGCRAIRFTGITPMAEAERTRADHVAERFSQVPGLIAGLA